MSVQKRINRALLHAQMDLENDKKEAIAAALDVIHHMRSFIENLEDPDRPCAQSVNYMSHNQVFRRLGQYRRKQEEVRLLEELRAMSEEESGVQELTHTEPRVDGEGDLRGKATLKADGSHSYDVTIDGSLLGTIDKTANGWATTLHGIGGNSEAGDTPAEALADFVLAFSQEPDLLPGGIS